MFSFVANVMIVTVDICMLCFVPFPLLLSVSRPTDGMSLSYADVVSELAMVMDGVLAFTDSLFYC